MGKTKGRHRNYGHPMKWAKHAPKRPRSPLRGRGVWVFGTFVVLNAFPSNSQWVLNIFPKFSMCSPTVSPSSQCVPNGTSLCPIRFAQHCCLKPKWVGLHWDLHVYTFGVNTYILGSRESFRFFIYFWVMGQSKRLIARPPKQRKI
jgi:hypothetical protein